MSSTALSGHQPPFRRWVPLKQTPLSYPVHILSSLTCCFILLQKQDSSGKFIKPNPVCLMSSLKLPWPFLWVHLGTPYPNYTVMCISSGSSATAFKSGDDCVSVVLSLSVHRTKISRGCTKMKSMCNYPLYCLTIPPPKRAKNLRPTKINRDPPQTLQWGWNYTHPPCVQCVQWKVFSVGAPNKGKLLLG